MKSILLIRTDAIGDYVLFRNFLKEIKSHQIYQNSKIILLGNLLWKDIALKYDAKYIDQFIWLDRIKYSKSRFYRVFFHLRLALVSADVLICAVRTPKKYFEDEFVKRIRSKVKIGSVQIYISNQKKLFTTIINPQIISEFEWNKQFLADSLGISLKTNKLSIAVKAQNDFAKIVLIPCASETHKSWSVENYTTICAFLCHEKNEKIRLCGSESEIEQSKTILEACNSFNIEDLSGKTTLVDLIEIIAQSKLVICNDSAAVHIAMALNKKVICLYKGDYYGRFLSDASSNIKIVVPPFLEKMSENERINAYFGAKSDLNIDDITADVVKEQIVYLLKNA